MATFPEYATILMEGYSEEPDYGVLRSEMDGGIAKQRPTRSKPIVAREARIMVKSRVDKLAFDEWARVDLSGGSGWFDWLDCLDEITKRARIVGGKYKWATLGRIWIAQCQIETIG